MSPHSDILSWFRANQSLLFLLNAACLAEKQQIPCFYSLWTHDLPHARRARQPIHHRCGFYYLKENMNTHFFRHDLLWKLASFNSFEVYSFLKIIFMKSLIRAPSCWFYHSNFYTIVCPIIVLEDGEVDWQTCDKKKCQC